MRRAIGLENSDGDAGLHEMHRRCEAGIARAHDRDPLAALR